MSSPSPSSACGTVSTSDQPVDAVQLEPSAEFRRFARKPYGLPAALNVRDALSRDFDTEFQFRVIVRNISRSGACFLFFRQLFPEDLVSLDFGAIVRLYKVARCRRLAEQCYEIGVALSAKHD
jgi:hypothetical protein